MIELKHDGWLVVADAGLFRGVFAQAAAGYTVRTHRRWRGGAQVHPPITRSMTATPADVAHNGSIRGSYLAKEEKDV
ncbi:hypothetical protein [Nocardia miyunensis]|uniref:hypothetical protein n=1 Tax=Nocardia miyunensis TaxID=282684 RepID=UPI000AA8B563|nr:hypothetical protein [Nocardia miyunensis]